MLSTSPRVTIPDVTITDYVLRHAARLSGLGALAFAPGPKGSLSVTLSRIGAWLYRKAETWTLPAQARPVAVVGADNPGAALLP